MSIPGCANTKQMALPGCIIAGVRRRDVMSEHPVLPDENVSGAIRTVMQGMTAVMDLFRDQVDVTIPHAYLEAWLFMLRQALRRTEER
jgi:hypothetical protein